jgi:hypothetical protein
MLHHLLLIELTIYAFLYDFHYVILRSSPVKSMPKRFTDDRAPIQVRSAYTPVYILQQLYVVFS